MNCIVILNIAVAFIIIAIACISLYEKSKGYHDWNYFKNLKNHLYIILVIVFIVNILGFTAWEY